MRRLRDLLYWQAQFDSKRPVLWLWGALTLLLAGPGTWGVLLLFRWRSGMPISGTAYLAGLTIVHAATSMLFVVSHASRGADERRTGFLAILQMTDIPAATLTMFRFFGGLAGASILWVMRLPLYVWCYHLGGVTAGDFLAAEAVLWLVTIVALSIAMACAQVARSSQLALTLIGSVVVGIEALFYFPRLFMALLRLTFGPARGVLSDLNEWSLVFSRWSLVGRVRFPPADATEWFSFVPGIAVHLAIAIAALWLAFVQTFSNVIPDDSPREAAVSRPPRRVTGDALAWQAVHVHIRRARFRTASLVFDVTLLVSLAVAAITLPPVATGVLALAIGFRGLATASMRAGLCVFNEIQDQTLSTLALLPRAPLEFFAGWRAGGIRASRMEYSSAAVGAVLVWWTMGDAAAALLGFMAAMVLAPPFGFLNSLCRFEWAVFSLSLWLFPLGFAFVALSIFAGVMTNQWGGLAVFCVLAMVYHRIVVRQIPYYFQRAVERG